MFKTYNSLCDVVTLLAYCSEDNTCLMVKDGDGEYWLPLKPTTEHTCWKSCITKMVQDLFSGQCKKKCEAIQVNKIWLPHHRFNHIFNVVYKLEVNCEEKRKFTKPAATAHRYHWLDSLTLESQKERHAFKSPEVTHLLQHTLGEYILSKKFDLLEKEELGFLNEYCEELVIPPEGTSSAANFSANNQLLLRAAGYTKEDKLRIYREFLMMVYPYLYMSVQTFTQFLHDLGWQKQQGAALFRAADVTGRGGLSFPEFITWTAAQEPNTEHRGIPAEMRLRYIFRYFDKNRDQKMEYSEFEEFITTTRAARKLPVDSASVIKEAEECLKQMELPLNSVVTLSDFLRAVGELKLRGTSTLLRAPRSINSYFADLQSGRDREPKAPAIKGKSKSVSVVPAPQPHPPPFASPVPVVSPNQQGGEGHMGRGRRSTAVLPARNEYNMASYTVWLDANYKNQMLQLNEFNMETVSPSTVQIIMPTGLAPSVDVLGPEAVPVQALAAIQHFVSGKARTSCVSESSCRRDSEKMAWSWEFPEEEARFGTLLLKLAEATKPLFEQEPRLLKLSSPIYAVGDLHGNLGALLALEKTLWPYGVALCPATIIFLGDYVDRGVYGTELMAYLLAVKLQRPCGVALIRGNHETRDMQKMFTFYKECLFKYGEIEGTKIWNAINTCFDALPLAAVVDDKVFCCHGGIPPPWVCPLVTGIERVPVPLPKPSEQSTIAWELLWNDPIMPTKITGSLAIELAKNEGFASNPKRGTGHVFDQLALERFLVANHLSHVVRAHELHQHGFMMQMKGRLISVFSSSHYCGGTNDSGVAFMDGRKLRILRVNHDV